MPLHSPHLFSVVLEDYYQVGAFRDVVEQRHWYRFESRLERSAEHILSMLGESDAKATFFVLGWVAEQVPELIRRIADAGHEIADRGYLHLPAAALGPTEFLEDLRRGREAVARASGREVYGHRCCDWLSHDATTPLALIAREGYRYDSSVRILGLSTAARQARAVPSTREWDHRQLQEVPVSSIEVGPFLIPAAGGAWLRHLPASAVARARDRATQLGVPLVTCVHSWELDVDQPRIASSRLTQLRHYRNLDRMDGRVRELLRETQTTSIAAWMGLHAEPHLITAVQSAIAEEWRTGDVMAASAKSYGVAPGAPGARDVLEPLSIVIPCFNEATGIGYLERTLAGVADRLSRRYELEFVFVDDGSRDDTWRLLQERFGARADCTLVRHPRNRGVSAAIRSGVEAARSPVVASIDADCTYDPHEIERMVPLLAGDVAMVTASPYHPGGGVKNVPPWRLLLSRGLSRIYRPLLHNRLHTITSCCRVYRRDMVLSVPTQFDDYRGIAEWLVRIDLAGGRIVEHPTVLESRVLGSSKMNVMRCIVGHLGLSARLTWRRLAGTSDHLAAASAQTRAASITAHALPERAVI